MRGSAFGKRPAAAQEEAAAAFEKWNQKRAPTGDYSHEKWPQKRARTGDHAQDVQARAPSGRARQATNSFRFSAVERRADTTKKAPSRPSTPLSVAETRNSTPFTAPPLLDGAKAPEVQDKLVLPFAELMQHLRSDGASGIVGREEEQRTISTFLDGTVRCKPARSGALYVSGRPGCGKTLSVRTLTGKCNRVAKVAWINGMTLVNGGRNLFSDILEVVDREVWSRLDDSKNDTARQLLPKLFCRKSSRPTILVLDELDALIQSGPYQSTLSSLFAWTRLSGSKLVLIGIANTCDLTHRFLPELQRNACAPQLLPFMPYEKQHIFDILCERLRVQAAGGGGRQASSPQVVLPDAGASRASESSVPGDVARSQDSGKMVEFPRQVLELCAAKIAAESGDIRKTLEMCREAASVVVHGPRDRSSGVGDAEVLVVDMRVMLQTLNRMLVKNKKLSDDRLRALPTQQALLLCAIVLGVRAGNVVHTRDNLFAEYRRICLKHSLVPLHLHELPAILTALRDSDLVKARKVAKGREVYELNSWVTEEVMQSSLGANAVYANILVDASRCSALATV